MSALTTNLNAIYTQIKRIPYNKHILPEASKPNPNQNFVVLFEIWIEQGGL
jgi:hypothetical protein